jgi:type IV secretory pathway VirB3-like protein
MRLRLIQVLLVLHLFTFLGEHMYLHVCVGNSLWSMLQALVLKDSTFCRELRSTLTTASGLGTSATTAVLASIVDLARDFRHRPEE